VGEQRAQVLPDQLIELMRRGKACPAGLVATAAQRVAFAAADILICYGYTRHLRSLYPCFCSGNFQAVSGVVLELVWEWILQICSG
jgi:hypothetical protein